MPNNDPRDIPSTYLECYADFQKRVEEGKLSQTNIYSFQQEWGDTTCGHGGVGGQAITPSQTYVFDVIGGGYYVYQGGRFSYRIDRPSDEFFNDLRDWNLVGERDYEGQYER